MCYVTNSAISAHIYVWDDMIVFTILCRSAHLNANLRNACLISCLLSPSFKPSSSHASCLAFVLKGSAMTTRARRPPTLYIPNIGLEHSFAVPHFLFANVNLSTLQLAYKQFLRALLEVTLIPEITNVRSNPAIEAIDCTQDGSPLLFRSCGGIHSLTPERLLVLKESSLCTYSCVYIPFLYTMSLGMFILIC